MKIIHRISQTAPQHTTDHVSQVMTSSPLPLILQCCAKDTN